jgi:hypothetical protein
MRIELLAVFDAVERGGDDATVGDPFVIKVLSTAVTATGVAAGDEPVILVLPTDDPEILVLPTDDPEILVLPTDEPLKLIQFASGTI